MVFANYDIPNALNHGLIHERPGKNSWSYRKRKHESQITALEEDIRALRMMMELAYRDQHSFTADLVIEISRALDLKINEYMKLTRSK